MPSSSESESESESEAEAEAEAEASGSEGRGQSATSSEWDDLPDDDDPTWIWDDERESEELREYFGVCRIDPPSEGDRGEIIQGPSPAVEAPAQRQTGATSQVDPILAAAHYFHGLGIVTVILDLQEKEKDDKVSKAVCGWASGGKKPWNEANLGNCLQEFAKPWFNSIAIVTGESDFYAVDVDVKDGGFEALRRMLDEHDNFPEDTPRLTTGNGGMHVLFSLSQSAEAGLRNCANREKIRYHGKRVGIDTRGRGGMLYTAPNSYMGLDGTLRCYTWDHEILPDRSNLQHSTHHLRNNCNTTT